MALAAINSERFNLGFYMSLYDQPLGIAKEQMALVFARCHECDQLVWHCKKEEHQCPWDYDISRTAVTYSSTECRQHANVVKSFN
jgi:hypothetical protein